MKNSKIWVILFVLSVLILQFFAFRKFYREYRRISGNFNALMQNDFYRDSLQNRTGRLLLDAQEIKKYFPEVNETIKRLDIRIKELERYGSVATKSEYQVRTPVKDTLIIQKVYIHETPVFDTVKVQYTEFKDDWLSFRQAIVLDSAYNDIQTRDSISIVQSWSRPKKFWFIRWGRKQFFQTVKNHNPYSRITHSFYLEKQ